MRKQRYSEIWSEHWGVAEDRVFPVLWVIWIGLGFLVFLAFGVSMIVSIFQGDWWLIGKLLMGVAAIILSGIMVGVSWWLMSLGGAVITLAITAVVCLFTAWYKHAHQAEEKAPVDPEPTPPPPPPKPKPTPPPPKPEPKPKPKPPQFTVTPPVTPPKPPLTPEYARQQWEQLISRLQAVGREIDQVASSSALRNEFEVLRAAVLHEGGIKLANEHWEDLEVIVKLTQSEISSLSPVSRSLDVLGISRDQLTLDRLKKRHRQLAKAHHPDTGPAAVPDRMASINESYQVLKKYLTS